MDLPEKVEGIHIEFSEIKAVSGATLLASSKIVTIPVLSVDLLNYLIDDTIKDDEELLE